MRPRNRSVRRAAFGLLLASFTVAACSGVAAPATGPGGTQGQGSGSVGATNAASQGTSDGQGGGAVTLPDPCSLLTPDEIRAQFTFDVAPGIGSSAPGSGATSPDCNWSPVDYHPSFGGVQLIVEKFDEGYFDFRRGPNSKDVAGLGDEAYFIQPTNPFSLLIKKGNLHFTLTVQAGSGSSDSPETLQQRVITLATNVLAHL